MHRAAGKVFVAGMLTMATIASVVSPLLPSEQAPNTTAGLFTIYLVTTAWMTARRRPGEAGRFEVGAFVVALAAAAAGIVLARIYARTPNGAVLYPFSLIAALAAAGDLRTILGRGLSPVARLARHIWRMSLAMFVATASFFLGQPQDLPAQVRGSFIPTLPVLAVLGLMIFWLIRVRLNRAPGRAATAAPLREATT